MHAYERHFEMIERVSWEEEENVPVAEPPMRKEDADWVLAYPDKVREGDIPDNCLWLRWLYDQAQQLEQ